MNPSTTTLWWLACGIVVVAELVTGSLYLLMIGVGLAAGAAASMLGVGDAAQLALAAAVGGVATVLLQRRRSRMAHGLASDVNPDVNQDIGAAVQVAAWGADRRTHVTHRGARWSAHLLAGAPAESGAHVVVAVQGNWLVLAPVTTVALPSLAH